MSDLNACTECGFTSRCLDDFTLHIEMHEEQHKKKDDLTGDSSGELLNNQTCDWTETDSPTPSPPESGTDSSEECVSPSLLSPTDLLEDSTESDLALEDSPKNGTSVIQPLPIYSVSETTVIQEAVGGKSKTTYVCPHCNFTTFMSQHMKSHLEAHERHQGQMYQCDICNMQFSQKANMHRHRMRHSGVKPYECRYCKKRFFRKDQMQEHSMTHIKTGIDFDCPVAYCSMQFGQHSQLRVHLDECHNISSTAPASCKRCALLFANSRRLLLHYQTRHDDAERHHDPDVEPSIADITIKKEKCGETSSPRKRRSTMIEPVTEMLTPQKMLDRIQQLSNKDLSPTNNTDTSDHSASPEYEQQPAPAYPMTNEDLLLMCLAPGVNPLIPQIPQLPHPTFLAALNNKLAIEQTMRMWAERQHQAMGQNHGLRVAAQSPSVESGSSHVDVIDEAPTEQMECNHCGILFFDQTMHLLHKGLHTEGDPWKCNLCGLQCGEKYIFTTHVIFASHSS